MALNVVSSDRLSTNVKTSNLATGLSSKVGESKNLVINGNFQIAQRGTTANTSGYKTVDRFNIGSTGMDEVPTQAQVALTSSDTGPWAKGFRYALQVTNGNQTSGAGAGDNIYIYHYIEAQDIASSGWDYTNSSSKLTLSFWVKSSVAQNFYGVVKTMDGTAQLLSFETTALSANTWKKVTLSIPGHANLQFDTNAEAGFQIAFSPFFGTDYTTSGKTLNAWAAYSGSDRMPDFTSTWFTTNDATFALTGIQLEVGDTATEFEHRSFGDELARCQRYFYMRADGSVSTSAAIAEGRFMTGSEVDFMTFFPVTMRTTPSIYQVTGADYFAIKASGYNQNVDGNWTLQWAQANGTSHYATPDATGTTNMPAQIILMNSAARLGYNAEL